MDWPVPRATHRFALGLYPGVGHSPSREDSASFNRELAALARRALA
jgi:pimeloyl-ACP methyl ester carboxylesterase